MTAWQQRFDERIMRSIGMPLAMLERGEGVRVWDDAGNEYLDFLAGIAVNSLGHAHPVFVDAVATQAATLAHVSNYFTTEPQLELAERLTRLTGAGERRALGSATPAPRPSRRRSSSRASTTRAAHAPASSPSSTRSTAAPWARSR